MTEQSAEMFSDLHFNSVGELPGSNILTIDSTVLDPILQRIANIEEFCKKNHEINEENRESLNQIKAFLGITAAKSETTPKTSVTAKISVSGTLNEAVDERSNAAGSITAEERAKIEQTAREIGIEYKLSQNPMALIKSEDQFDDFNVKLEDRIFYNVMLNSCKKRLGIYKTDPKDLCHKLCSILFHVKFWEIASWTGTSRRTKDPKICFNKRQNVFRFFHEAVNNSSAIPYGDIDIQQFIIYRCKSFKAFLKEDGSNPTIASKKRRTGMKYNLAAKKSKNENKFEGEDCVQIDENSATNGGTVAEGTLESAKDKTMEVATQEQQQLVEKNIANITGESIVRKEPTAKEHTSTKDNNNNEIDKSQTTTLQSQ